MFRPRASGIRAVVVQIYRLYRSVPSLSTREKKTTIYPDFFFFFKARENSQNLPHLNVPVPVVRDLLQEYPRLLVLRRFGDRMFPERYCACLFYETSNQMNVRI